LIVITRHQALHLRSVLRRAFGSARSSGSAVGLLGGADGLVVKALGADVAVEYHLPGPQPAETLWLLMNFLADCEAKNDEPVELEATGKGRCTARWRDGNVPQIVQYESAKPPDLAKFPARPETMAANPTSFRAAFAEASDTTDPNSTRYALGCVRLRGDDGSLAATDGRQLLVQSGFQLPWAGDVLVPRTKVFAAPELSGGPSVTIGKSDDWLTVCCGPWTVHLRIDRQARFPKIEDIVRSRQQAQGTCTFSAGDLQFLADTLPRLPVSADNDYRVTLDLNGQVILRAQTAVQAVPTEVVLRGSSWTGPPMRLNLNGRHLARAARLGPAELAIFGDELPIAWQGEGRTYISTTLPKDCVVAAADNAVRIESPLVAGGSSRAASRHPRTERKRRTMNDTAGHSNGHTPAAEVPTSGQAAKNTKRRRSAKALQQDSVALVEQALKLRAALHDLLHQAGELVKALKQHRRANRAVQTTLASLRQLKSLGV